MNVHVKYVVYEFNNVLGSEKHKALQEVNFKDWRSNKFDTETDAINALVDDGKTHENYVILRQVYIN